MPQWAKRDEAATRAARKTKEFVDRRSWKGWRKDGSPFIRLHGRDKQAQRERLLFQWNGICARCGDSVIRGDEDLDHIIPLGKGGDDSDMNLQLIHGMRSQRDCHRAKHNREIRLRSIPTLAEERM